MCKVAAVSGITDKNRDDVWLFMIALGDIMTRGNDNGIGYAAFDKNYNLFGERWLVNNTWLRDLSRDRRFTPTLLQKIYSFFGEKVNRESIMSIILHTRMATNAVCIQNTHPFVDDQDQPTAALIHNGVISNDYNFKKIFSTCDSEVILTEYLKAQANLDPNYISKFTKKLEGWYTCFVATKDAFGRPVIDMFSNTSRLVSYFVPELGVRIYSSESRDIVKASQVLGFKLKDLEKIECDTFFRINAETGDILSQGEIQTSEHRLRVVREVGNFDDEQFRQRFLNRRGTDV